MSKRTERITLRIFKRKGHWKMNFCGEETGDLTVSPSRRWVCGVFFIYPGSRIVMTDRRGLVLQWLAGGVSHLSLSDSGVIAVKEFGSNGFARIRCLFPDGSSAQPGIRRVADVVEINIDGGDLVVDFTGGGESERINIGRLSRRPIPKAVVHRRSAWHRLHLFLTVITLGLWAPVWAWRHFRAQKLWH